MRSVDSRLHGNDSPHGVSRNALFRHSREGGNDAIDTVMVAATTVNYRHSREGGNDAIDTVMVATTTVNYRHSREGGNP